MPPGRGGAQLPPVALLAAGGGDRSSRPVFGSDRCLPNLLGGPPGRGTDRTEAFIPRMSNLLDLAFSLTVQAVPTSGCRYHGFVTLIISALTDEYVTLASDRRVTWSDGRQVDTDTKTFNLFGQFLMGFTGLARINGLRMERWVADALRGVPADEYFNVLAQRIGAEFDRLRPSDRRPQAFLATGYASLEPGGRVYPMNVVISNSIDNNGDFSASAMQREFTIYMEPLGNRRHLVRSVGWPMPNKVRESLEHKVRVVTRGDPCNPERAAGPLVYALRETAAKSKEYVGRAALFTSLPRCAVPSPGMVTGPVGQLDFRQQAVSLYLPNRVRNPRDADVYMPAFVGPQLNVIGVQIYPGALRQPMGRRDGF